MHDEFTNSNTGTDASTNTDTEADTDGENTENSSDETIPVALGTAFTDRTASSRNTISLSGELLSKHTLRFRNTGKGKSKQTVEGGPE